MPGEGDLTKDISKQSIEGAAMFLLAAIVKCKKNR